MNSQALTALVDDGSIDTVIVCMVDMQGRLVGKRFHARFFLDSGGTTHACDYLLANDITMEPVPGYAAASWERGYGDFELRPDLATLRLVPWLAATALVLCDVVDHHGELVSHSPRAVLQNALRQLAEENLSAKCASELEFYLFEEPHGDIAARDYRAPALAGHYIEDYHILQTSREEPLMRQIRNGLQAAGIAVENTKGEWGPGQAEINVVYDAALAMADKHVVLKNGIKEMAALQGKAVTFMAKWRDDLAGNSCHIHLSLWDVLGAANLSFAPEEKHGLSRVMQHFIAGLLRHAREVCYLLAPNINSYKRFQAGTFAPTTCAWSMDNRTAGFRLVGLGTASVRIECRIGGGDLNPYLAYAALISAGLAGIKEKLALPDPLEGDAYAATGDKQQLPALPTTLREALDEFAASTMLRHALGDAVVEHYVHAGRWEQAQHDAQVTDWEVRRGLEQA